MSQEFIQLSTELKNRATETKKDWKNSQRVTGLFLSLRANQILKLSCACERRWRLALSQEAHTQLAPRLQKGTVSCYCKSRFFLIKPCNFCQVHSYRLFCETQKNTVSFSFVLLWAFFYDWRITSYPWPELKASNLFFNVNVIPPADIISLVCCRNAGFLFSCRFRAHDDTLFVIKQPSAIWFQDEDANQEEKRSWNEVSFASTAVQQNNQGWPHGEFLSDHIRTFRIKVQKKKRFKSRIKWFPEANRYIKIPGGLPLYTSRSFYL